MTALDTLLDQLRGTLAERDQAAVLKEMAEIMATDVPALPLYFRITFTALRSGVHALTDDYTETAEVGTMARHSHLWDKDN